MRSVVNASLERHSLAEVHRMPQHDGAGLPGHFPGGIARSVIDHNGHVSPAHPLGNHASDHGCLVIGSNPAPDTRLGRHEVSRHKMASETSVAFPTQDRE